MTNSTAIQYQSDKLYSIGKTKTNQKNDWTWSSSHEKKSDYPRHTDHMIRLAAGGW